MNEIAIDDGRLTFSLPSSWLVQAEDDGAFLFYEDLPESGTLRLNLIEQQTADGQLANSRAIADLLQGLPDTEGAEVEILSGGRVLLTHRQTAEEQGTPLVVQFWLLATSVGPSDVKVAAFSFALDADKLNAEANQSALALLDEQIRLAQFHEIVG